MNDILGLLDSFEALILEGRKIPFTENVVLDERRLLAMIDKIRLALRSNGAIIRQSIDQSTSVAAVDAQPIIPYFEAKPKSPAENAEHIVKDAELKAQTLIKDAKAYTNSILANMQLMVTKMQKNLINIEKNLENGRAFLDKSLKADQPQKQEEFVNASR